MPETLYEVVMEVEERVLLVQGSCQLKLDTPIVTGNTGEKVGGVRGGQREISVVWYASVFYGVGVHEFRNIVVEFSLSAVACLAEFGSRETQERSPAVTGPGNQKSRHCPNALIHVSRVSCCPNALTRVSRVSHCPNALTRVSRVSRRPNALTHVSRVSRCPKEQDFEGCSCFCYYKPTFYKLHSRNASQLNVTVT